MYVQPSSSVQYYGQECPRENTTTCWSFRGGSGAWILISWTLVRCLVPVWLSDVYYWLITPAGWKFPGILRWHSKKGEPVSGQFQQHTHTRRVLFTAATSLKVLGAIEGLASGMRMPPSSLPNGDWSRINKEADHSFLPGIRGQVCGKLVTTEAKHPDRQGRVASLLASFLPRFISYCQVTGWLGLLMSVCVFGWVVCVCSDVGHTTDDRGGHEGSEATCTVWESEGFCMDLAHWLTDWLTLTQHPLPYTFTCILSFPYV